MAVRYLDRAIDQQYRLAVAAQTRGDYAEAQARFLRVLGHEPQHLLTRINLAVCRLHSGRAEEAAHDLRELRQLVRGQSAWKRLRYSILYNLAAAEADANNGDAAIDAAHELAKSVVPEASAAKWRPWGRRRAALAHSVEGPALALLATTVARFEPGAASGPVSTPRRRRLRRTLRGKGWMQSVSPAALADFAEREHGDQSRTQFELAAYDFLANPLAAQERLSRVPQPQNLLVWAHHRGIRPEPPVSKESSDGSQTPEPAAGVVGVEESASPRSTPKAEPDDELVTQAPEVREPPAEVPGDELALAISLDAQDGLAIWSSGCAVELDRARRTDPESPSLYGAICRAFGRRLMVDVVSAAGDGAVGGAMLASAIVSGRAAAPRLVRDAWIEPSGLASKDARAALEATLAKLLRAENVPRVGRRSARADGAHRNESPSRRVPYDHSRPDRPARTRSARRRHGRTGGIERRRSRPPRRRGDTRRSRARARPPDR